MNFVNLRKTGAGWEFETEADLEDFVWANLKQLLGLTPLKRQYFVKGEFCDILALDENKHLVVLELKKTEDRYVVQQLTRYYHNLLEEKPFLPEVDYEKSIRLIAIVPGLATEASTIEALTQKLREMIPELILLNNIVPADHVGSISFELIEVAS